MKSNFFTGCFILLIQTTLATAATIHGFIRDKESREPIVMGNVWIKDSNVGTTTNLKGYYVLSGLKSGKYQFYFRYIGYKTVIIDKNLAEGDDIELNIFLELEPIVMETAIVTAERDRRELEIKPSQISMQIPQLRGIPQVAEPDLFRAIQMLPGVATLSDFSAGLYIRGGTPDQNLILLDQIDVYNPNHMFGFFSSFNTDAIKSVELLKGGFPAMYGGRLSSVLNVVNKEGNREHFHGVTRLSLISSTATLEGPWQHGSWMVSGRRTYLDLAAKMIKKELPYYFYDGHARINFDIDRNNQASVSAYMGNDILDLTESDTHIKLKWGNKTFSTQWMHLFSSKLYSHFVFAGSRFDSDTEVKFDEISFGILNQITDLAFKGSLTYTPSTRHTIDFGFENKMLDFNLKYKVVDLSYPNSFAGNYYALYFQDNFRLTPLNILQAGLRLDHYTDGNYWRLTPRLALKHMLSDQMNLTLSYGQFAQFLNLVQQEGLSFADMWFPVDHTFKPGRADHYILGFSYDNQKTFSISVEGFYKDYLNLAEYRYQFSEQEGTESDLNHMTAADNFIAGTGYAYGGEVYLRNNFRGLEGWIGYTLNWVKKQVDGFNLNAEYFPTYDRRHTITAIQDYRLSRKWRLNFALKFGSGQPYTEATARYQALNPNGTVYDRTLETKKNAHRLPPYYRLDVGAFYSTRIFGLDSELYLQVINVHNYKNVWFRYYQFDSNPAERKDFTMLPLLPTFGISVNF